MSFSCAALAALASAVVVSDARDAHACGGGFSPAPTPEVEAAVVSDHRMVFSLGAQQTVLWDQIRYTGNPTDFAWVLPVRPGTTIELSHDEWIASLDAVTQPQIVQPTRASFGGNDDADNGGGCGCGGFGSNVTEDSVSGGSGAPPPSVQVVSEAVVGPYESVIVRSDEPQALETWLNSHGFEVPPALEPTIAAYTAAKMDFAALRLRPGQGVQAMQPVRIVSPGADPSLPLRMVQAGVSDHVALTLYVISEGRYRPMNFPEAVIDDTQLRWDDATAKSNYLDLSAAILAQAGGTTWLTEYADKPVITGGYPSGTSSLYNAYYSTCYGQSTPPAPVDGGFDFPTPDAGDTDAGDIDASDSDAGADGGSDDDGGIPTTADAGIPTTPSVTVPSPVCQYESDACCQFDDLQLAVSTLHSSDVWVTRLRADLPASALNVDLVMEAHPSQTTVSNVHNARFPDGTTAQIAPVRRTPLGTGLVILGTGLLVGRVMRRKRRA